MSLPASMRSRKSTVLDSDQENVLADKSLLVECLTNAGMVVKTGEEQNILQEDQAIINKKFMKTSPPHLTTKRISTACSLPSPTGWRTKHS